MKIKIKEWRMETRGKNAHLRGLHGKYHLYHFISFSFRNIINNLCSHRTYVIA
jgi:hypothetical protein